VPARVVTAADATTSSITVPVGTTVTTGNLIQPVIQPISTVSTVNATSLLQLTTQLPLPTHLQQQLQHGQAQII
jgi:hypothetical protein